jgi:predicted dehydrogenase
MKDEGIERRRFMKGLLGAAASVSIVPRHVLGGPRHRPPSDRITRAVIGTGSQGRGHVRGGVTLAVCDVNEGHMKAGLARAGKGCKGYRDWREVLDRDDIDTIHIATPPHWHALMSIAAAQAGKDVYSEKPATHFIREGRVVVETIKRYGRVYQANTHGRRGHYGWMKKLAMSGLLGTPLTIRKRGGFKVRQWSGRHNLTPQRVPKSLDYDMWLGPAPVKPFHPHRTGRSFRGYWDYDEGGLGDMGQHYIDPMQYVLGKDDESPVEVEAEAPFPQHPDAAGMWGNFTLKYADGTTIYCESGEWGEGKMAGLPILEGPNGKVYGNKRTDPPNLLAELRNFPNPPGLQGWEHCVRTRQNVHGAHPNAEQAHRSVVLVHLAAIAIRLGRKLRYDPVAEKFVGDDEANRLVDVPMRAPWHL